jgi:catechol 2,3-dioxygenase-like lactoylglutathione lyase family enzyme
MRRDPQSTMLGNARIGANVPVSNLDQAISFYEGKLGLTLFERGEGEPYARFAGGAETKLGVYESKSAGQSKHTLASFVVDDVRATVRGLQQNGVAFEEYDMPGMKTEEGVATMGDTRAAWLKDPDGNILEIVGS